MIHRHAQKIFLLLVLLLTVRVILPQLDGLKDSLAALRYADAYWIVIGIFLYFLGVPNLAVQFTALALKKLKFRLTLRVEAATLFANKILPSGLGTISLNAFYLAKEKHTPAEATSVVTMNMITSFVAYSFLILMSLLFNSVSLDSLKGTIEIPLNALFFIALIILGLGYTANRIFGIKQRLKKAWTEFKTNLKSYRDRPRSVIAGLLCNGLGSSLHIFVLILSARSIGIDISFAESLLAYTFGNIAAAVVPTPGGIGVTEAGIYAGLVLFGVDGADAITITLIYRFISYWLPILPGYYYFWSLRKTTLAGFDLKSKPKV